MEAKGILDELNDMMKKDEITKNELMVVLKKYARIISTYELMLASVRMRQDGQYVQSKYREKYLEIYIKYFILRMKEIIDNNENMEDIIDIDTLKDSFHLLETTFEKERLDDSDLNDKFPLIYVITSLYTTFILEEPIHPVGSEFPGSLKVSKENGIFYCPVKDKQKDNPNAICHLCLAEQAPNI